MKLIIGLGNPGRDYIDSRHNVGFFLIRELARINKFSLKHDFRGCSLSAKGRIDGEPVALAIPLTFMNLSGSCVKPLLKKYKTDPAELLVVCDDLDLELGRIKLRPRGSSGGHRGLGSVIDNLGTQEFSRLRIGIGRPGKNLAAADYVLSAFAKSEKKEVEEVIDRGVDCCRAWLTEGVAVCMNTFNKKE